MTRLATVLGPLIEVLNGGNRLGALKIDCPSQTIYLMFYILPF